MPHIDVTAWCGRCGQRFRLVELCDRTPPASCPRCGELFAPGYASVVVAAARQFLAAAGALAQAGTELTDVATGLHVDAVALSGQLTAVLDPPARRE